MVCDERLSFFLHAERSFATRARFCGGVPIVCTLIKSADGVMLDVCLRLVKALAKSGESAGVYLVTKRVVRKSMIVLCLCCKEWCSLIKRVLNAIPRLRQRAGTFRKRRCCPSHIYIYIYAILIRAFIQMCA